MSDRCIDCNKNTVHVHINNATNWYANEGAVRIFQREIRSLMDSAVQTFFRRQEFSDVYIIRWRKRCFEASRDFDGRAGRGGTLAFSEWGYKMRLTSRLKSSPTRSLLFLIEMNYCYSHSGSIKKCLLLWNIYAIIIDRKGAVGVKGCAHLNGNSAIKRKSSTYYNKCDKVWGILSFDRNHEVRLFANM